MITIEGRTWLQATLLAFLLFSWPILAQNPATSSSQTSESVKTPHKAAKDDLDAIGSRKIGSGGMGNWYSLETEIAMGQGYSQELEARTKLIDDPVITEFVNRMGQNLVRNSDAKVPFTIKVIDSDEVNAFALPGGFLFVNSGLITAAENEAELAGVMSHEIAHVAARHATRQMTRSQLFNLASIPLIFVGGGIGVAVQQAAGLAGPLSMMKFSRGFESEADYLGVEYLYKAGYDPQAFISFFERIQVQEKQKPGLISKAFAGHPQTSDRIHKTQSEIQRILPPREAYVITTSEFEDVRQRLMMLENRHHGSSQEGHRPSLRRQDSSAQKPEGDDESPKLKRRKE